ncbi:hypothetical protein H6H00_01205 [Pseudonocardia petroleophila]|uniref:Uncharacterized protein n=1 Tax=Pseudonocardia petroleophila TaxID=37331 RepID=A0A7G7MR69_9PSEU|nr:hypothetical protein H6H00_01205 [Pseudonocardia petroleophila]
MAATSALLLTACGDTAGSEAGADVADIQQEPVVDDAGVFDTPDYADPMSFVGQTVTVSAEVNDLISTQAFTIAGTLQTGADELLIVGAEPAAAITEDSAVEVTGTVMERFDVPGAEAFAGTDLDDGLFTDYDGEPYIQAETIELLPATG